MKKTKKLLSIFIITILLSSCTTINKTIKQPFSGVEIKMSDFSLSEQQSARATSVTILGIDFERLFIKKMGGDGSLASSLPIIGQYLSDPTTSYAMYDLLENDNNADFIFYPQIEKKSICPIIGICFINRITTVEVKARTGTFK
jgi:hypothetical protein|tara:strand:+ start:1512 stop:1943 length:432 start_codon:yes stop_codon:yes gene_type:complete